MVVSNPEYVKEEDLKRSFYQIRCQTLKERIRWRGLEELNDNERELLKTLPREKIRKELSIYESRAEFIGRL